MKWSTFLLFAVLAVAPAADAKGLFQAKGTISELQRRGDEITFRFVGSISFSYVAASDADPKREMKPLKFIDADVLVRISDWTRSARPLLKMDPGATEIDRIFAKLSDLTKAAHTVRFSVDNPGLSFSNLGELTHVSGTHVYAVDANE